MFFAVPADRRRITKTARNRRRRAALQSSIRLCNMQAAIRIFSIRFFLRPGEEYGVRLPRLLKLKNQNSAKRSGAAHL
jgi:hypothetical protein